MTRNPNLDEKEQQLLENMRRESEERRARPRPAAPPSGEAPPTAPSSKWTDEGFDENFVLVPDPADPAQRKK